MKKSNEKFTILYARLSQEDSKDGVSNSIENQQMILEKFAKDNAFENALFMADDGFSGTNFNRPSWVKIMKMIEDNQVETLIVKDLSRLGRDHLELGKLLEITFPEYNVRFITTNDGIDTLYGMDDFTPFKALFAEYYAKECSRKIKAVINAKANRGERVGTRAPFGYRKKADNPKQIEPDPEVMDTIKRIFELCISGRGPSQIVKQLELEQRISPTMHYYNQTGVALKDYNPTTPYHWHTNTVTRILSDEVYLGHTINMKYTSKSFKNKKRVDRPESEWLRFENTHDPIISKEDWDIAQTVRQTKKRPRKNMDTPNMLSGLVFCADCGKYMVLHRAHTMKENQNNYACSTYKRKGKTTCTAHYIRENQLITIILDDLKRVTHFARMKEKEFAEFIARKSTVETRKQIIKLTKDLDTLRKRNSELNMLFKRLYEDSVMNRIPSEVFRKLSDDYLAEQKELQIAIPEHELNLERLKGSLTNAERFISKAKKYEEIPELTPELIRQFVDKVIVYEKPVKYSRVAEQKVKIYYRDIGYLGDYTEEIDIAEPVYDFELLPNGEMILTKHIQEIA